MPGTNSRMVKSGMQQEFKSLSFDRIRGLDHGSKMDTQISLQYEPLFYVSLLFSQEKVGRFYQ